jgi:hypothetical protein
VLGDTVDEHAAGLLGIDATGARFMFLFTRLARHVLNRRGYHVLDPAIALANGLTVVTHNTREFRRMPGLLVEDWET